MIFASPNNDSAQGTETALTAPTLSPALLELLASRICHDLISPVGAVHNGVEFLQEMGIEDGAEAVGLIAHSAQTAAARLQAFRLAYGAAGRDPNIKPEDVHETFGELIRSDGKITQDWDPHGPLGFDERPLGFCKLLMGVLMLAQECLPKGGKITVAADGENRLTVTAEGQDALVREQVEDALARTLTIDDLDPRLVHPYALSVLAAGYGFTIAIADKNDARVVYTLSR